MSDRTYAEFDLGDAKIPHVHETQTELVPLPVPQQTVPTPTPLTVIEMAVRQGATVETLTKLFELQERVEARDARKSFDAALAAFKANPPKLEKVKKVNFESKTGSSRVQYNYAPLDYICAEIGSALSKHGLSFTWNVDQSTDKVKVTCILRHAQGYSESVTMLAPLHDDTRMNAIQRLGSTITYLERYSLLAATGLSTGDEDNDGMTMGNAADFIANIETSGNRDELGKRYKEAVTGALQAKDPNAVKIFMKAREKREKELAHEHS